MYLFPKLQTFAFQKPESTDVLNTIYACMYIYMYIYVHLRMYTGPPERC